MAAVSTQPSDTPAQGAVAITPNDGTDLSPAPCKAIWVGVGGTVVLDTPMGDTSVTFLNVPSGSILPVGARRVRTGSTATNMVALY